MLKSIKGENSDTSKKKKSYYMLIKVLMYLIVCLEPKT